MIISVPVVAFFCWLCGCIGGAIAAKTRAAAASEVAVAVHKPVAFEEEHEKDPRNLGLTGRDPTGFLVRYVGCPAVDDTKVVLEICPTYRRGGAFGGTCTRQLANHFEWVKFHHNFIVLRMLHDFCEVCSTECPYDAWENATRAERSSGNKFPDICNSLYEYYYEPLCGELCEATTNGSTETTNKHGSGKIKQSYVIDQCKMEGVDGLSIESFNCSSRDFYGEYLSMKKNSEDSEEAPMCLLSELYEDWTDSVDEPGYPTMVDEIQHLHGQAFLQCSFVEEHEGENTRCRDFYYEQLQPCAGQEPHYSYWYNPRSTPSPTEPMCRLRTTAPTPTPTTTFTAAPSAAKVEEEEAESPSSPSSTLVTRCVLAGAVVIVAVAASWYHRRYQRPSGQWDLIPELDLELREEPQQGQDETPYHRVVEMRDVGGAAAPPPPVAYPGEVNFQTRVTAPVV